ncbi:thiamine pyrophosphate-dependent dehydrogenase E1 component subunit alpha [Streptomyces sp. NPDC049954]|uniref:thiamine pyrophosphate-dependent dehydrogenase E1 component subunit alpha n=1 Tax=Streptomyces sp. NPDC049954 TaxID=3155779 RepID=UPI003427C6E3
MDTAHSLKTMGADRMTDVYRVMTTIRAFEEGVHQLAKELPGAVHLYSGQEAVAAGVCAALADRDHIAATHRGHGHAIAKGCDVTGMMKELFGKSDGLSGGKGGSMHIADFERGMLGANGLAGGGVALACGAALSSRQRGTDAVAVAFTGDGGANQGVVLESFVLARMLNLPVLFVVENNGYAQATPASTHLSGTDLAARAAGFGIPGELVDGYDAFAVYEAAHRAVARARAGQGPTVLECRAERFHAHMEQWDDQAYRPAGDVERLRAQSDPLTVFRTRIAELAGNGDAVSLPVELDLLDRAAEELVKEAVSAARSAPDPEPDALLTDVYTTY